MSVYQIVYTSSGLFVLACPCYFCQCPGAKNPYFCFPGYGRPVLSPMRHLHSVLLKQHYQSHFSRTCTSSSLTETNISSAHDALTLYLLGNLWLPYLELYVHNSPDILTAQPLASNPRLSALISTIAIVVTSSFSSVTSCTSNVSAALRF